MLSVVDSLLPNSALMDETRASGLAIKKFDQVGSVQFLNLTVYLISNNFPAESNGKEIYKWLKIHGKSNLLQALLSMKGPSAEALLENLFQLAVEAEDIPIVKSLLHAGANPNGGSCMFMDCPDPLTPLQFACLNGNTELAKELIKAGSSIDEPGTGWKSSALVLAIFGHHIWLENSDADSDEEGDADSDEEGDADSDEEGDDDSDEDDFQHSLNHLVDLINCLIDAGANVNLEDANPCKATESLLEWKTCLNPGYVMYALVYERHSALTAAAKYRYQEVVDLLIKKEAGVQFKMECGISALRECLYSSEDWSQDYEASSQPLALSNRNHHCQGSNRRSRIIGVIRSLLHAGADLNDHVPCDGNAFCEHFSLECHSPLDLAVLTRSMELIEMMLCKGAQPTERSLDNALEARSFKIFCRLLNTGVPIPEWVASETDKLTSPSPSTWPGLVPVNLEDLRRGRAAIIAAVHLGEDIILNN
jgi:ankyrin repeat protein